ncbi:MAG: COX15/CtaA family protein, partial [Maricaulaceae bacterium]
VRRSKTRHSKSPHTSLTSQYRLATHLGLAFVLLAALFWSWRDAREEWPDNAGRAHMSKRTGLLAALVYIQIIAGAFVAGTHSGKSYNTWPAMDGGFVPGGYGAMTPFWKNMFENSAAIQFNHRFLAYVILALLFVVAIGTQRSRQLIRPFWVLAALVFWQVILGIWTLLMVAPLNLSLLHQFSSIFVFLAALSLWRNALISRAY